jgi:HSP20 family molecular chaperone IbpA
MIDWPRRWGWPPRRSSIRIEEYGRDGRWVVRAELPGVRPDRDITVMVADNEVTIDVRHPIGGVGTIESEFSCAPARRTVLLPRGVKDETLTATYRDDGILEISVERIRPVPIGRTVPVACKRLAVDNR